MSTSKSIAFRIPEESIDEVNKILKEVMNLKEMKRGEALIYVFESFSIGGDHRESITVQETMNRVNCNYLSYDGHEMVFECLETIDKKREPKKLSSDPLRVVTLCLAHKEKMIELEDERQRKLFEKASVQKLTKFMNQFRKMTKDGLIFDVHMCLAQFTEGKIGVSYDGENMICPLETDHTEDDPVYVNIEDHCMTIINDLSKQLPPCKFITYTPRKAIIDEETLKKAGVDLPALETTEEI